LYVNQPPFSKTAFALTASGPIPKLTSETVYTFAPISEPAQHVWH
jgi:hypothetical protein